MEPGGERPKPPMTQAAQYLSAGLSWVVTTGVFAYVGFWADGRWGTKPWLTLIGAFVGAAAGFYSLMRQVTQDVSRTHKNHKE